MGRLKSERSSEPNGRPGLIAAIQPEGRVPDRPLDRGRHHRRSAAGRQVGHAHLTLLHLRTPGAFRRDQHYLPCLEHRQCLLQRRPIRLSSTHWNHFPEPGKDPPERNLKCVVPGHRDDIARQTTQHHDRIDKRDVIHHEDGRTRAGQIIDVLGPGEFRQQSKANLVDQPSQDPAAALVFGVDVFCVHFCAFASGVRLGGRLLSCLVCHQLQCPLQHLLRVEFRGIENNRVLGGPQRSQIPGGVQPVAGLN